MADVFFHKWSFHSLFDKPMDALIWLVEIKSGGFAFDPSTSDLGLGGRVPKTIILFSRIKNKS